MGGFAAGDHRRRLEGFLGRHSVLSTPPPPAFASLHLNDANRYQRAYLDFFEDELVRMNYNWKDVVIKYMLVGPEPLLHGAIGGCMPPAP